MMLGVDWADIKCEILFIAQAERIPDQRGDEDEVVGLTTVQKIRAKT
jgi:hypothetical protein